MSPEPPRLFARPLLGDALRATGLTLLGGTVVSFPFWLPTRWIVGVSVTVGLVALWCVAFLSVRMHRDLRRLDAEAAARPRQTPPP